MLCPIEDQRRGEWQKWGTGSVVWKECRPTSETKEAAAALNVLVVCPSPKPQANHIPPLQHHPRRRRRHHHLWPLCYRRRKYIGEGNQLRYCNCWKREVEDLRKLPRTGCFSSPLPRPYYASSAVRWCGAGDITQNKGVLKQGMSEPRLALPLPLKSGQMPLWDQQ